MARVTGIGGIFFKSKDPEALKKWYRRHLGIESRKSDVGARFDWQESTEPHRSAYTVWAPFRHDTRYFDPSKQSFMINYRVDDLDALVGSLKAAGIAVHDDTEPEAYGRFAWLMDPEGNRIELWAPAPDSPKAAKRGDVRYPFEGGCLCRAVRFRVAAPPVRSGYCHCRFCQLNSGAPVVAWAEVAIDAFAYTGASVGVFRSSSWGQREFCPACGSYLVYREQQAPKTVSINTASLDDPSLFPPTHHIFASRRIPWFDTAVGLPRYDEAAPT